jgi:hypothetical protein
MKGLLLLLLYLPPAPAQLSQPAPKTTSEIVLQWLTPALTLAAVLVALFKDWFWAKLNKPILEASYEPVSPWFVKMPGSFAPRTSASYWVRIRVENLGKSRAEKVEVYASKLQKKLDGKFTDQPGFLPLSMTWSNSGTPGKAVLDGISSKMAAYCDLVAVFEPIGMSTPITHLCTEVDPSSGSSYLRQPGTYRLVVRIAAANAKPIDRTLSFSLSVGWKDNEEEMGRALTASVGS